MVEKNTSFGMGDVLKGKTTQVEAVAETSFKRLANKQAESKMERKTTIYSNIEAPVKKGDQIGKIQFLENGKSVGEVKLVAKNDVKRLGIADVFGVFITKWVLK